MALSTLPEQRTPNHLKFLRIYNRLPKNPSSRDLIKALLKAGYSHIRSKNTPPGCAESLDYFLEGGHLYPGAEGRLRQMYRDLHDDAISYLKELRGSRYDQAEESIRYVQRTLFE